MKNKKIGFVLFVVSTLSWAGGTIYTTTYNQSKDTQTRVYAGLVWVFNNKASLKPDLSIGVQTLRVKSSDSVSGADFNVRFKVEDGLKLDSNRISYIGGERSVQGQLGFGYSYTNQSWLTTGSVNSPFNRVGADYLFINKSINPFIEINTIKKPNKVNETATTTILPI